VRSARRATIAVAMVAWTLGAAACAPPVPSLPSGAGVPFPDYAAAYQQATLRCKSVKTIASVLTISGRAVGQRFPRATLDVGFEAPDKVMLELPAPGRPIFTFAANGNSSTLILARDGRVLEGAPPAATLEALTGIPFGPEELGGIVTGCGFAQAEPAGGRTFPGGRAAIDAGNSVSYLAQSENQWRLVAARRGPWDVFYDEFVSGRPSSIRLVSMKDSRTRTDLRIRLSQVDVNEPIDPRAFSPAVPAGAKPITLDDLRQAGPLGR
jgi:hypothetical protein